LKDEKKTLYRNCTERLNMGKSQLQKKIVGTPSCLKRQASKKNCANKNGFANFTAKDY